MSVWMLLAGAMPPYYADATGPAVRNPHSLTPRELDKVITWATGGTPHGDLNIKLPAVAPRQGWPLRESAVEQLRQLGAQPRILELEVPASASSGLRALGDSSQLPAELLPLLRQQDPYGLVPSAARPAQAAQRPRPQAWLPAADCRQAELRQPATAEV